MLPIPLTKKGKCYQTVSTNKATITTIDSPAANDDRANELAASALAA